MACGETAEPLRGRGIGGRLIVRLANELSAEGFSLFSSAPPNGCTSIPVSASKNWASMRAMKRPQSKIGGDIST